MKKQKVFTDYFDAMGNHDNNSIINYLNEEGWYIKQISTTAVNCTTDPNIPHPYLAVTYLLEKDEQD